jgi:hypothetical protein
MICKGYKALMAWQKIRMQEALAEMKWLLSEREGRDVGSHAAAKDFHEQHLDRCAADWRARYCGALCEHRHSCELGSAMIEKGKGR